MNDGKRLVRDIGGGSTELILGEGSRTVALESLHMGCVSLTERFFPAGQITAHGFTKARTAARLELRPVKRYFRADGEIEAIGTSGTILSAERAAADFGFCDDGNLTLKALEKLIAEVQKFDNVADVSLRGVSARRAQVWPGGLSILAELFYALQIDILRVSDGALREGLLYDLLGRMRREDARERTVRAMEDRYSVDKEQAERVATTSEALRRQCSELWGLDGDLAQLFLDWSARLHEIGLDISHDGYQRHGAYVAENADMPGFPRAEQRLLAFLIGSQRHAVNMRFRSRLPRDWRKPALRLGILLRLGVLLNRSRSGSDVPIPELSVDKASLHLRFDARWLQDNPLTAADLKRERKHLKAAGYTLSFDLSSVN